MPRSGELAITVSVAVAAMAAGYALYTYVRPVDTGRTATSTVAQSTAAPELAAMQAEPASEPLLVANPFDASEIFEFPAGTSEADAREAVAGFLIDRATRRGVAGDHRHRGPKG